MTAEALRIGFGFDVHAFSSHPPDAEESTGGIMLGGVYIPFSSMLKAHSDGDVLLHALCDSMLGAAALGDLGKHFPNDEKHRGISSRELLRHTTALIGESGFGIVNIDATVVAEKPRLAPFVDEIRALVASDLHLAEDRVNIKATSTDHLGFTGRGEGIAAFVTVLLMSLHQRQSEGKMVSAGQRSAAGRKDRG